jgi:cytochrome P450
MATTSLENLRLLRELRLRTVLPGLRDVAVAVPGDLRRLAHQVALLRAESTLGDPPPWALALLRRFRPVIPIGRVTLATRARDVVSILCDDQAFNVQPYAHHFAELAGPFPLGLDGAEHAAARQRLAATLAAIDLTALRAWADEAAERLVTERCRDGRLDVVTDLAERLPARFAATCIGVPGPDEDTLVSWSKTLFEGIFLNLAEQRSLAAEAAEASRAMRSHIDELVAHARRTGPGDSATVLGRMIAASPDAEDNHDATARSELIGLVVGTVAPVSEAIARSVDQLLGSAGAFAGTRSAAEHGDHEMLWRYVREALRFSPQSPGLLRQANHATTVGQPAAGGATIGAGQLIFAATSSAMRDPSAVEHPTHFRPDRPETAYLHFGAGPHRCLGERVAQVLMTAAAGALFRRQGLRRVPGRPGRLTIEGRWPAHLTVAL